MPVADLRSPADPHPAAPPSTYADRAGAETAPLLGPPLSPGLTDSQCADAETPELLEFRSRTSGEEEEIPLPGRLSPYPVSKRPRWRGRLHLLGAAASVPLGVALVAHTAGATGLRPVMLLYALATLFMFGASAALHTLRWDAQQYPWALRTDYAAIYFFIASSYTALMGPLLPQDSWWPAALLSVAWALATAGIASKFLWRRAPKWMGVATYLGCGWAGVPGVPVLIANGHVDAVALIMLGGLLFTAGGVVFATETCNWSPRVFGYHEVFHLCTVLGVAAHWACAAFVVIPTAEARVSAHPRFG